MSSAILSALIELDKHFDFNITECPCAACVSARYLVVHSDALALAEAYIEFSVWISLKRLQNQLEHGSNK